MILNGMTSRIVDRVKVGQLSLGQTTSEPRGPGAQEEQDLAATACFGIDTLTSSA